MGNKDQRLKIKDQKLNEVLVQIIKKKKEDLALQKKDIPISKLKEFVSNLGLYKNLFREAILNAQSIALIAEIKLASPSDQSLNSNIDIMDMAGEYEIAGADAISYITEKHFFNGDVAQVIKIAAKVTLPILQKDFVIDEYQIYEAKIVGSNALLLIARLIDQEKLKSFVKLCKTIGIEPVVEINSQEDLNKALKTTANIIAVNARDLSTFEIDVDKACELLELIPAKFVKLGFSGISSSAEVKKYQEAGASGVLVGTSLMKSKNVSEFIKELKQI